MASLKNDCSDVVATMASILRAASRMSFKNHESLRVDTLGLSQNVRTHTRLQSMFRHEVHISPEQARQFLIQSGEFDQPNPGAGFEIRQDVDVALGTHVSARGRTKDGEVLYLVTS